MNGKQKWLLASLSTAVVTMLGIWAGFVYAEIRAGRDERTKNGNRLTAVESTQEAIKESLGRIEAQLQRIIERGR